MAYLPDDFAFAAPTEERRVLLKGVVLRQQLARLAMKGLDATKAARVVGCHPATSRAVYRDPTFRREVYSKVEGAFTDVDKAFVEDKKSLHQRLAEEAESAFTELVTMLHDASTLPSIKVRIAQDFLDRNPETQAGHTITKLSPALQSEQLSAAAASAREMDSKVIPMRRQG